MSKREQIEREFSEKKHEIEQRLVQLEVIQTQADKAIREGFKAMRDKELEALAQEYGFHIVAQAVEGSDIPNPPGLV